MGKRTIRLDDTTEKFYEKIARNVGLPVERVLADALFKTAGEMAAKAIREKRREQQR